MAFKSLLPTIFGETDRDPFRALQRQIDQVFSDFSRDLSGLSWPRNGAMNLFVDVAETDKALEVSAEMPGVEEKDIKVTLAGDVLTIKGEKKSAKDEKGKDYRLSERSYGMYERSMALPFRADASKIEAKFEKGVLKVTVAKPPEAQAALQQIPVKAAA
jgi:HSP20 family protein